MTKLNQTLKIWFNKNDLNSKLHGIKDQNANKYSKVCLKSIDKNLSKNTCVLDKNMCTNKNEAESSIVHNSIFKWMNECILVVINLIVSSEHSVHFNTNVCSRFCCTPRPFQACGYPLLLLYMGVRFSS